jgi:MFS family permease
VIGDTVNFSTISGTAVIVPLLLSSFCAGMLAEKLNRKWLFLVSLGLVAMCTFAMAFSNKYAQIFGLTMVYGFLEGLASPALISLITDYFPQNR